MIVDSSSDKPAIIEDLRGGTNDNSGKPAVVKDEELIQLSHFSN